MLKHVFPADQVWYLAGENYENIKVTSQLMLKQALFSKIKFGP